MVRCLAAVALLLVACRQSDNASESEPPMTLTPEAPAPPTTAPSSTSTTAAATTTDPASPAEVLLVDPIRLT